MSTPARWILLLALPLASCIFVEGDDVGGGSHSFWGHSARGSGVRVEAERQVADFHAIKLETSASVVVKVGESTSVHLSGDDNLLPKVETKVENGVLSIDLPGSYSSRCGLEFVATEVEIVDWPRLSAFHQLALCPTGPMPSDGLGRSMGHYRAPSSAGPRTRPGSPQARVSEAPSRTRGS